MMNENLRDTLVRKLEHLPDETARQLLDYIEFLESKYHRSVRERTTFERFADNIEETLSATRLSKAAVKGTAQVLDAAGSVMRGVVAAGQAVVSEIQSAGTTKPAQTASDTTVSKPDATAEAASTDAAGEKTGEETGEERLTKD